MDIENTIFESYKGPDSPVDLIILGNVLMYVCDKDQEVTRCLQWLKPGGHLLIIGRKCTRADLLLSIFLFYFFFFLVFVLLFSYAIILLVTPFQDK